MIRLKKGEQETQSKMWVHKPISLEQNMFLPTRCYMLRNKDTIKYRVGKKNKISEHTEKVKDT